ncbi:uncharacterized protein ACO6RY_17647 [Pungitius sinensis]
MLPTSDINKGKKVVVFGLRPAN